MVGKAYIISRDQSVVVGKGKLTSPALSYTVADLERDLSETFTQSLSSALKGVEPVAKATTESESGEMEVESGDSCDQLTTVAGKTYHVGDVVYLTSRYSTCVVNWSCDVHVSVT